MQIEFKPGMRVRCVRPDLVGELKAGCRFLERGAEYLIAHVYLDRLWFNEHPTRYFFASRFNPVVRVKATCVPSLSNAERVSI